MALTDCDFLAVADSNEVSGVFLGNLSGAYGEASGSDFIVISIKLTS